MQKWKKKKFLFWYAIFMFGSIEVVFPSSIFNVTFNHFFSEPWKVAANSIKKANPLMLHLH